ncbi:MAG: Rid family hydrolase [Alloprevotella sp.]
MENCRFCVLQPEAGQTLLQQADDLLRQIENLLEAGECSLDALLQMRIYVTDAANQCADLRAHRLVTDFSGLGVVSFVEQPPLGGGKLALLLWFVAGKVEDREVRQLPDGQCLRLTADGLTYLFQTVRWTGESIPETPELQTKRAFESHEAQLRSLGLNLQDHCQRTWIYVRDVDNQYAEVVKARNEVFSQCGLTPETHFIASTGIGGASECVRAAVAVDFFSVGGLQADAVSYLHALDYLNPTHEYGVAFERGTRLSLSREQLYMISGTASIDRTGACVHRGDVLTQAGRLFLNIEKLLQSGGASLVDVPYFVVYLRDVADRTAVSRYLRLRFPDVPCLVVSGRVCRPEWLIEVECMAVKAY